MKAVQSSHQVGKVWQGKSPQLLPLKSRNPKRKKVLGFLKDAADFLILDDVKTVFDPKASLWDKDVAIFSVTPTEKALKAGRLGFKLVRNSPVAKWVSPKKVDLDTKGTIKSNTNFKKIKQLVKNEEVKGNNIITKIDDEKQVIFRRGVGVNAHLISPDYPEAVDHYNVEIQTETSSGKWKLRESYHIVVDKKSKVIDRF